MNQKQMAAEAALKYVGSDMVIGLGTGSTADYFLIALGNAIADGTFRNIRGVPTSKKSEARARELGIPLTDFAHAQRIHVTIDGADEVAPDLTVIKGLGGALLREKVVAQNSDDLVVIVDQSKKVPVLGTHSPLPVEVTIFGFETQPAFLQSLGATPILRRGENGNVFITDNGNYIYDCRFEKISDPAGLEARLSHRAGIVESGLFVGIATHAIIATDNGLQEMHRRR
jgi:ribose 5-phosphate isomerase A